MDATVELIVEAGIDALRMNEVARRAGTTRQSLAYYFPGRDALIGAALTRAAELSPSVNLLHANEDESAFDNLRNALFAEFDNTPAVRNLNLVWNEAAAIPDAPQSLHQTLARVTEEWVDQVTIGVLRCVVEGSLTADPPPHELATILTVGVEGLSQRWLADIITVSEARVTLDHLLSIYRP